MKEKGNRVTIRVSPNQQLVLDELKTALNTSYSTLIRAIIHDFLTRNEESLERIICKRLGYEYDENNVLNID